MYLEPQKFGAAKSYRNVDLSSRIEGASAHALVAILFEELLKATDLLILGMRRSDWGQRAQRQGRVLSILQGLETSLDFDKGGDIARDLALVYREARRMVMEGSRTNDLAKIEAARAMIGEINSAWMEIA